jgi:CheY-like chemotaxis protein
MAKLMGTIFPKDDNGELNAKNILLVDDEAIFRRIYSDILTMKGYNVTECEDGCEALKAFQETPKRFDLIMTDYVMPELNGLRLAEQIRKVDKRIPIILCTGHVGSLGKDIQDIESVDAVLTKPLTLAEFERCIDHFLG